MTRVLFVCLGNICRSPTAEAVCRHRAPQMVCDSAGTSDWHVGDPPYGPMRATAARRGYDMERLRARQVMSDDFDAFDLVVGMDAKNRATLERLRPDGGGRLRLLTDWLAEAHEVPDPYYTRDFEGALDLIERAVDAMLADIRG